MLWRTARYGTIPIVAGVVAGVPMAFAAGYLLRRQLFGVGPSDLPTLVFVATALGTIALAAAAVPAIRATRIDPAIALRGDGA